MLREFDKVTDHGLQMCQCGWNAETD